MTYIIYHGNCFDGFTAAWVAKIHFKDAAFIGWGTGQRNQFPLEDWQLTKDTEIYILDFSFPREIIDRVKDKVGKIVIIDHHKTAKDELADYPFAIFDMTKSGALLTWEYFFPAQKVPLLVQYISDRDLWKFELPYSKELHAFIAAHRRTFENWDIISARLEDADQCFDIIMQGKILLQNHEIIVESLCKHGLYHGFFWETEDRSVGRILPVLNVPKQYGSDCCDYIIRNLGVEACVYWIQEKNGKHFGIRSRPDFDCSKIAKAYGGGGHAQASGWTIKND